MTTGVHVDLYTYTATHVATGMLRGLRQIIRDTGLDTSLFNQQWEVLERGTATWLRSGHLTALILEVYDPSCPSDDDLVDRFDFQIDYGYDNGGEGDLWLDSDAVAYAIRKTGSHPARCAYRVVARRSPGYPPVDGWTTTTLRSTTGFTRHNTGTALGGGDVGARLSYYTRNT
jgi:hypothetical protein